MKLNITIKPERELGAQALRRELTAEALRRCVTAHDNFAFKFLKYSNSLPRLVFIAWSAAKNLSLFIQSDRRVANTRIDSGGTPPVRDRT